MTSPTACIPTVQMENEEVKEVTWLRYLLPSFVPNARIATFSYPSDGLVHLQEMNQDKPSIIGRATAQRIGA